MAANLEEMIKITMEERYPDEYEKKSAVVLFNWAKSQQILRRFLLEADYRGLPEDTTIYLSRSMAELFKKNSVDELENALRKTLTPEYQAAKQNEIDEEIKKKEDVLNHVEIPTSCFFQLHLDRLRKKLNECDIFNRTFIMTKYEKGLLLYMSCRGIEEWAVSAFFEILKTHGLRVAYCRKKEVIGVSGIADENMFRPEGIWEELQNFGRLFSLLQGFNKMEAPFEFSYQRNLAKRPTPHFRITCKRMVIEEMIQLQKLLENCFVENALYQNKEGLFIAICAIGDQKQFREEDTREKVWALVEGKNPDKLSGLPLKK